MLFSPFLTHRQRRRSLTVAKVIETKRNEKIPLSRTFCERYSFMEKKQMRRFNALPLSAEKGADTRLAKRTGGSVLLVRDRSGAKAVNAVDAPLYARTVSAEGNTNSVDRKEGLQMHRFNALPLSTEGNTNSVDRKEGLQMHRFNALPLSTEGIINSVDRGEGGRDEAQRKNPAGAYFPYVTAGF